MQFSVVCFLCRNAFKVDELGKEIVTIALPALMALASDPFALLVDTAFIGHLGMILAQVAS